MLIQYRNTYDPQVGPIIPLWVMRHDISPLMPNSKCLTKGLIDTGAENTHVSKRLAETIQLDPIDEAEVSTYGGDMTVMSYRATLLFEQGMTKHRPFRDLVVYGAPVCDPSFDVWIGRDVLAEGQLVMGERHWFQFEFMSVKLNV